MAEMTGSPASTPKKLKFEQLRADYELFLQTFEKPTWLYRYLQRRNQLSPYMLNRNLSYLRQSSKSGSKKKRNKRGNFKIDSLLSKHPDGSKTEEDINNSIEEKHFLNLSFGGFFHGPGFAEEIFLTTDRDIQQLYKDEFVQVNIHVIQIYHKRRKDITEAPMDVTLLGTCQAPWNPASQLLLPCSSVQLSVPPSAFDGKGRAIKTHILSITVSLMVPKKIKKRRGKKKKEEENLKEPPSKRQRSTDEFCDDTTSDVAAAAELKPVETILASFSAELIIYDRHRNCLLTDGDYELLLQENTEIVESNSKNNSWESKFKSKLGPFAAFSFGPTIKFSLRWESKPSVPVLSAYMSLSTAYESMPQPLSKVLSSENKSKLEEQVHKKELQPRIFYQFIYNGNTRQQTEAKEGTCCPFCTLNCKKLYGLLKHLKCCHQRFSFLYTPLKKGCHRVDVCVNDNFENTLDLNGVQDMGFINIDNAPLHRKSKTEMIVARPHKPDQDLSEFTEPCIEDVISSPAMGGHERIYYHSRNNSQITHQEAFENFSQENRFPDWMLEKIQNMIEEFTDVNEGEKALMKLWNIHMLKKGYIADFCVGPGCITFVKEYGDFILKNNLKRNFLLHLNNLIEFQVISQTALVQAMDCLNELETKQLEE